MFTKPRTAREQITCWAQAVLKLVNLAFVVLDTTGLEKDADIIRVLVVNLAGAVLYDQFVKPLRYPHSPNTTYTTISQVDLDGAQTLAEQWEAIQAALHGKFVLLYGEDFARERLDDAARAYGLSPISFVGECLMYQASLYFHKVNRYGSMSSIGLAEACSRVSYPRLIGPSAPDRAAAQIALLKAIADGQPRPIPVPITPAPVDKPEDFEHPF